MVDATVNDLGGLDVVRDFVSLRSYR
jgi:hypothetical protein